MQIAELHRNETEKRLQLLTATVSQSNSDQIRSEDALKSKITELTGQITGLQSSLRRAEAALALETEAKQALESQFANESEDFASKVNRMTLSMQEVKSKKEQLEQTLRGRFRDPEPDTNPYYTAKVAQLEEQLAKQKQLIAQLESDLQDVFSQK